jgi:glycosyltransferase involved in cell wall biosynthesis
MRVLIVYNKAPFPLKDGGAIAVNSLASGLAAANVQVRLFALNPSRNYIAPEAVPEEMRQRLQLSLHPLNTDLAPHKALFNLVAGSSFHISRFFQFPVAAALQKLLEHETFDIIQLEAPFVGMYLPLIRKFSKAPIVLRAHNVEYLIWQRLAAGSKNPIKAWYLKLQARRLQSFESKLWREVDGIAAISEIDAQFIRQHTSKPVISLPTGLELGSYPALQRTQLRTDRLGFLGSMDWQPNQEAVRWFVQAIWPKLQSEFPGTSVTFAGKNFPDKLLDLAKNQLFMQGEVADATAFRQQHPIFIVPMRSGSGIRIKLLEAMALGLPIISTTLGAEGLPVVDQKHLLLADDAASFAKALHRLQKDEDFAFNLGQQGRQLIENAFNLSVLTQQLTAFYTALRT